MKRKPHSKETKRKIAESVKQTLAAKRLENEVLQAKIHALKEAEESLSKITMVTKSLDDIRKRLPRSITDTTVKNALRDTESGRLVDYAELAEECASEPQIRSLLQSRKTMVAGKDLYIEPSVQTAEAKEAADLAANVIARIPTFKNTLLALMDAIFTGVTVGENIWKYNSWENIVEVAEIHPVHLGKLAFDEDLDLAFDDRVPDFRGKKLKDFKDKFIVHAPKLNHIYPIKDGLFRSCVWLWFLKQHGWVYYSAGLEKTAYPILYAVAPSNASPDAMANIANQLSQMHAAGSGVIKNGTEIREVNNAGASVGNIGYQDFIKTINDELTRLFAGGNLVSQIGAQGSRAAAETHAKRAFDLSVYDGEALAQTLKDQLVKPIIRANLHKFGGKMPPLPNVWFDLKEYRRIDADVINLGIVTPNQILAEYGLPPLAPEVGDSLLRDLPPYASPTAPAAPMGEEPGKVQSRPEKPAESLSERYRNALRIGGTFRLSTKSNESE